MKKWIGYLLSLYLLLCIVVPCTLVDNCEKDDHTVNTAQNSGKKDCNECPPFSICSSIHGFTLHTVTTTIEPVPPYNTPVYPGYHFSSKPGYTFSFFQPPRFT